MGTLGGANKTLLTDNSLDFFHSFYSACTFACCVAHVFLRPGVALPPSRQSACLFMYGLNHASAKMPLWFSQNNTQSRQEAWHHQFPCSSACKMSTLWFTNLDEGRRLMSPSSLDENTNNLDVRLCRRIYILKSDDIFQLQNIPVSNLYSTAVAPTVITEMTRAAKLQYSMQTEQF